MVRIIPTRVGTRFADIFQHCSFEDHPHACGDKIFFLMPFSAKVGSSPRVWGQGLAEQVGLIENRIIPTRVGTSSYSLTLNAKD